LTAGLAGAVDSLYRDVVMEPDRWSEAAFAEWLEALSLDQASIDRDQAKQLRRAARMAMKLQSFWLATDAEQKSAEPSWRARVDIAVGVPAWRPALELSMNDLLASPSEERFADVRARFRVVNGTGWLEGTSYDDWIAARSGTNDAR